MRFSVTINFHLGDELDHETARRLFDMRANQDDLGWEVMDQFEPNILRGLGLGSTAVILDAKVLDAPRSWWPSKSRGGRRKR